MTNVLLTTATRQALVFKARINATITGQHPQAEYPAQSLQDHYRDLFRLGYSDDEDED